MRRIAVSLAQNGKYWQAQWRDHLRRPRRQGLGLRLPHKGGKSRRIALAECRVIEDRLNAGLLLAGRAPVLGEWVAHFRATRRVADSTAALWDAQIDRYILPHFGPKARMDRVTVADVETWVKWLDGRTYTRGKRRADAKGTTISDISVANILRTARMLWHRAGKVHRGLENPFAAVTVTAAPRRVIVPQITEAQVVHLAQTARTDAWRALVGLCGLAGMRYQEALLMTWDRVLWDRRRLLVPQPKTARRKQQSDRECWLCPALADLLQPMRRASGPIVAGGPRRNQHRDMVALIRRAGLEPWPKPFHGLRKWRASTWRRTRLGDELIPEAWIDSWLGHGPEIARTHYVAVPESAYA